MKKTTFRQWSFKMSNEKVKVITEEGKLCFDKNLFEANEDGKFSAAMVLAKGTDYKAIQKLMMDVAKKEYGDKIPKKFTWGMKSDKEADTERYPFLEDAMLVQGGTKYPIPVVDIAGNEVDRDGIKGGDTVRFSISAYCYEFKGKRGVSLNINSVLLVNRCSEEDAFYKKPDAKSMFGDVFSSYADQAVNDFEQSVEEAGEEEENFSDMGF